MKGFQYTFWSPPFSAFSPTTLWHTRVFFICFYHSLIKKSRGKKRALSGVCGSNLRSAAELSSFASRLHKLTASCTLEQRASYQSAVSGLPWCSSSSVDLPHNEGWLATHYTVFLHTVVIRCNNNHKKLLYEYKNMGQTLKARAHQPCAVIILNAFMLLNA